MGHKFIILLNVFFLWGQMAGGTEKIRVLPSNLSIIGTGILSYAFWDVYKATLYGQDGHFDPKKPHGLSIEYYRSINGKDIAHRSIEEIRKQGFTNEITLASWYNQMENIFPNVKHGTILTALYDPGKQTTFYNGNQVIGTIRDDEFGKLFFGIWLSQSTSEPKLRRALLGLRQ